MTGRSKDNWKGGRRAKRTTQTAAQRETTAEKSWKRSKRPAAAKTSSRPWLKIVFTIVSMIILVASAIWIFQPVGLVHTHFVMLDLLNAPSTQTGRSEFFDPTKIPDPPEITTSRRPLGKLTSSHSPSLQFANESKEDLNKAHVVIVYLQTQLVTDGNGVIRCLTKTSTPDLQDNQSQALSELKHELAALAEKSKHVLLIVDEVEGFNSWRLGDFQRDATVEVSAWPEDEIFENRLVVMTGYSHSQFRVSAPGTSGGGTFFSSIVSKGMSRLADTGNSNDNAKNLDVIEFCEFVMQESNRQYRNLGFPGGQDVIVSPSPDKLKDSKQNFVLLGELPTAPAKTTPSAEAANPQLADLWGKLETLNDKMAWRWRPMLWQQSSEFLLRTQQASLNQQDALAENLLQRANIAINKLEQVTQQIVPTHAQLERETGMPHLWFERLPNFVAPGTSSSVNDTVSTFPLQQNIDDYPFTRLGLATSPKLQEAAVNARRMAVSAARNSMSMAGVIPKTLTDAEQQSLIAEDRLFTSGDLVDLQDFVTASRKRWQAIDSFNRAHQRAELLVQRTTSVSESLAKWAAKFPFNVGDEFEGDWDRLLVQSLDSQPITDDSLQQRLADADQLALQTSSGISQYAVPLRSSIFRLLLCARSLRQRLHPEEPESGFEVEELNSKSKSLLALADRCQMQLSAVQQGFEELSSEQGLLQRNTSDSNFVALAMQIEATLSVINLPVSTRRMLSKQLKELKQKFSEIEEPTADSSSTSETLTPSPIQAAMWYAQHLNLFTNAVGSEPEDSEVQRATEKLADARVNEQATALANFGDASRNFWQQSRSRSSSAVTAPGAEAPQQLQNGDRLSRGFSAFDASRCQRSVTESLHNLWRVEYCLGHAQRTIAGQWVLSKDEKPLTQNGWFSKVAGAWLSEGETLAGSLKATSAGVPPFIATRLAELQAAKTDAGKWSVGISPLSSENIDLRRDNAPDADVNVKLSYRSSPSTGIAALQLSDGDKVSLVTVPSNSTQVPFQRKPESVTVSLHRNGTPGADDCVAASFTPRLFFRGRVFDSETFVVADPCVSAKFLVRRMARPDTATLTVFGDDVRPLAFVLDMSRSMNEQLKDGQRRYNVALDRLKSAIERQDEQHRGSLRVFGHRRRFSDPGENSFNDKYKVHFGKPDPGVNPHQDTVVELKQLALGVGGKRQFKDVIEKLRKTEPFGITPLLRSVRKAMEDDLNGKPGIVIAITDGIATDAGIDIETLRPAAPALNVPDQSSDLKRAIEENPAIKVIIVAFNFQDPDVFAALKKIMQRVGIEANQIVNARDGKQLDNKIRDALDPIDYRVSSSEGVRTAKFGQPTESLRSGLNYKVEYAEIAPFEDLRAEPGDQFLLKVNWTERRFEFAKNIGTGEFKKATRPTDNQIPWIIRKIDATLTRPQTIDPAATGKLDVTLMLDNGDEFSPVRQPAEIEFRFDSLKKYRAPNIQESYFSDLGAPGYRFSIPQWPVNQSVLVSAVWKMDRTTPEHVLTYDELQQLKTLPVLGSFPNCKIATTLNEDGVLDVRLDPIGPSADRLSSPDSEKLVEDIRIEVGSRGQLKSNESFRPDEVTTAIYRTEDGAVIFRFEGDYSEEILTTKEFAFTSRAARLKGAMNPSTMTIRPTDKVLQGE